MSRVGDLEIDQDLPFQRRQWRFERTGWVALLLVVLAALLGAFGRGPIAEATVGDADALRIEYDRLERRHAPSTLQITLGPDLTGSDQVSVWVDASYLEGVRITSISPEPSEMRAGSDRAVWVFAIDEPGQRVEITVEMKHERPWRRDVSAGVVDGPEVSFRQFVYP